MSFNVLAILFLVINFWLFLDIILLKIKSLAPVILLIFWLVLNIYILFIILSLSLESKKPEKVRRILYLGRLVEILAL